MKKATQLANTVPRIQSRKGLGGAAWKRLALTVRLKPHTNSVANSSDIEKYKYLSTNPLTWFSALVRTAAGPTGAAGIAACPAFNFRVQPRNLRLVPREAR
jgi:hypothetical protein